MYTLISHLDQKMTAPHYSLPKDSEYKVPSIYKYAILIKQ